MRSADPESGAHEQDGGISLTMRSKTLAVLFIVCLVAWVSTTRGQSIRIAEFGAIAGAGVNVHNANFQTLPGVPSCCPRYERGDGLGLDLSAFYLWRPALPISLELRLGYTTFGAILKTEEGTTVVVNGLASPGIFEHSVNASIGAITFSPLVRYEIGPAFAALAGPSVGYVLSNRYTEQEEIIQPSDHGTFENGSRIRNQYSGTTPGASKFMAALSVGGEYRLPMDARGSMYLVPQVMATIGLSALVPGMQWRVNSIKAGAGLLFDIRRTEPEPPKPPPLPPPPAPRPEPKHPILSADLTAAMVDSTGIERPTRELVIEDYIRTQYRPLLNYVFFDPTSAALPVRYHRLSTQDKSEFNSSRLSELETLPLYYEVLNIIGERLQKYPKAKIRIVGCNDDGGSEHLNKDLSKARAETVAGYLSGVWKVDPSRVRLEMRNLPDKPSTVSDSDGAEENRRAEIYSDDYRVTEPVFSTDTAHIPKPPVIRFLPQVTAESGVRSWEIATSDSDRKLKDFSGKDSIPNRLNWELEKERESVLATIDTVRATLQVSDRAAQAIESRPVILPVRHYTLLDKHRVGSIDTIISRYSLILFDFDRGALGEANRRIADFVRDRISDDAKVTILGYTDRIGTDEYNQQLSELRARTTQRYIGVDRAEVRGVGRRVLLYDNSLPEGRFYSRTVTVIVTTPTGR